MTVTKRDLVVRISEKTNLSQHEVQEVIEQLMLEITENLSVGSEVVFRNFGTFKTAVHQPKVGRNPLKPEVEITIPARKVVRFRPGKILKERVQEELGV
ncbi:MAG: integration host factor subunit beta [Verrucomicrobiales bacterium]|nr:integration host factor subunit beta [Verrucomicrobiales bacterium]